MIRKKFDHLYRLPNGNFYYRPDFVAQLPSDLIRVNHPIMGLLAKLRPNLVMTFSRSIHRYMLYRFLPDQGIYVHLHTCEGANKSYRTPGPWLYDLLRKTDLTKGGTVSIARGQQTFDKKIMQLDPIIKKMNKNYNEAIYEMNRAWEDYFIKKRESFQLGRPGRAKTRQEKKQKTYFINSKTGQIVKDKKDLPRHVQAGFTVLEKNQ